jgi:drug/metabolite transporter (DMT)-like permease
MQAWNREVTMALFWLSAALVVGANVAYHLCQKSISPTANPMLSVTVTFFTAGVASLLFLLPSLLGNAALVQELGQLNWASVALGLTIVGVDVGYLLLYRAGWNLSLGSVVCNSSVALVLLPVGVLMFKEKLSFSNYVGVGLALVGIYLITRR